MNTLNKTFSIDFYSKIDDRNYRGTFTTRKLTVGDLSKIGLLKAQMAGGFLYDEAQGRGVDPTTNLLNEMIAHCEVSLVQSPEWFDPSNLTDLDLMRAVYEEVAAFESNFHRPQQTAEGEGSGSSSEDTGSTEHQGKGRSASSFTNLVDQEIPKIEKLG